MDTSMQTLQTLVSEADAFNTKINQTLNVVVEANAGKEPFHSQLLACHAANDACGAKHAEIAQWGRAHYIEFHRGFDVPPPGVPETPTGPMPPPVTPNNGIRVYFGPAFAGTKYPTQAGGDGVVEFSVSSGSNYYRAWVNGVLVVDGGMSPFSVKAGDKIEMLFRDGPPNQINYTLTNRG